MTQTKHYWSVTEDIDVCIHCGLQRRTISDDVRGMSLMRRIYLIDNKWIKLHDSHNPLSRYCHAKSCKSTNYDKDCRR